MLITLAVYLMLNLLGATPEEDKCDFNNFVTDPGFLPDEIKLYPCAQRRCACAGRPLCLCI